jgi:hypothetical protein
MFERNIDCGYKECCVWRDEGRCRECELSEEDEDYEEEESDEEECCEESDEEVVKCPCGKMTKEWFNERADKLTTTSVVIGYLEAAKYLLNQVYLFDGLRLTNKKEFNENLSNLLGCIDGLVENIIEKKENNDDTKENEVVKDDNEEIAS